MTEHPLTARRRALGLTQEQLAQGASVSQQSVARLESGAHIHRGTVLLKIAAALDVGVTEILDEGQCDDAQLMDRKSLVALWLGLDPDAPATAPYLEHVRAELTAA
jgi:transcriptional regulator with XRE-family HTH domain